MVVLEQDFNYIKDFGKACIADVELMGIVLAGLHLDIADGTTLVYL